MSEQTSYSLVPDPSPEDAAAAIAAIERFLADTAQPPAKARDEAIGGWLRAALHEGVGSFDSERVW